MSRSIHAAALLVAGAAGLGAAQQPQALLLWGGDAEGGAPFVEADPADPSQVRGFDVLVAETIARGIGRRARFVQVQWSSIDQSVERGDFAIGLSGVEDTPARRVRHAVTIPYFEFREVLAVRPEDRGRWSALADLRGRRVATLGATMAYDILVAASDSHGVIPVSYDDDVHPFSDLMAGRVDAVLLDHIIAERSLHRLRGTAFIVEPRAVAVGHYVGVLARADSVLRDSVDVVLRAAMVDGTLERIFRRWNVWDESQGALFRRVAGGERDIAVDGMVGAGSVWAYLPSLGRAAVITAVLSALSMTLAIVVGVLVASGRVYGAAPLRALMTGYVEVMRGTPLLLQLFVLYYGLAGVVRLPAFLAAVLGLGLNYAAYEAEIYRGALEAVSRTQLEAARTLGFSERQILRLVRGPQALRYALAPMTNDFVALLKDSSLVSVLTVVELTKQTAIYATNVGSWIVPGLLCAVVYLAMSLPLSRLGRRLERRWRLA
ncbi:MAG TPA: ABC transporter permease subunit [Gemmatimonadales bacterium]|nr:ABC transporter permease subunit [Gemmatimonadales bacterium]